MKPQEITYGNGQVTKLDETNTYLAHSSELQWGDLFTPTIYVHGIGDEREKFDFYKAYKNQDDVVLHCEYRSTTTTHKLIIHT
jgi:hypothetical protein